MGARTRKRRQADEKPLDDLCALASVPGAHGIAVIASAVGAGTGGSLIVVRTLRQHVECADTIMSCLGVRTILPKKWQPARNRRGARNRKEDQRDYALSILIPLEAYDRTGWVAIYERASREAASSIWERIPDYLVCPECLSRAMDVKVNLRPQMCRKCGERRRPVALRGIVSWDIRRIKQRLREGDIQVG